MLQVGKKMAASQAHLTIPINWSREFLFENNGEHWECVRFQESWLFPRWVGILCQERDFVKWQSTFQMSSTVKVRRNREGRSSHRLQISSQHILALIVLHYPQCEACHLSPFTWLFGPSMTLLLLLSQCRLGWPLPLENIHDNLNAMKVSTISVCHPYIPVPETFFSQKHPLVGSEKFDRRQ